MGQTPIGTMRDRNAGVRYEPPASGGRGAPPNDLTPAVGRRWLCAMEGELILGRREVYGQWMPFGLSREDRRSHLYLLGQTGVGKSTMMRSLIAQDIANGEGCALIDPHGDLIESVLDLVPPHRIDDVVLVEPADLAHPVS